MMGSLLLNRRRQVNDVNPSFSKLFQEEMEVPAAPIASNAFPVLILEQSQDGF